MHHVMAAGKPRQTGSERETLVRDLCDFSVKGLVPMFDRDKKVFCYRVRKTQDGIVPEGESFRYTIITLLGLKRYEQHLGSSPISILEVFNETLNRSASIEYAGDAGLLLWLTAMVAPERFGEVNSRLDITRTWKSYPDATRGMTTELSWLLTGLCYAMLKGDKALPGLTDTAAEVFNRIRENYGRKGIFKHQHGKTMAGALRGNIGCFADQIYPIYALTKFAETHRGSEALAMAGQCSETICELQGSYGQWWWHYDARTGKTAGRYPVFSVHQEGMAPMALFATAERTGANYEAPIYKGLEWILGKNELGIDMRDFACNTIWRSFYQKKWKQNRELLSAMIGNRVNEKAPADLEILYECRPYCFGWLLYAFADKVGKQPSMQSALNSKEK
jgi:hypothetical protein